MKKLLLALFALLFINNAALNASSRHSKQQELSYLKKIIIARNGAVLKKLSPAEQRILDENTERILRQVGMAEEIGRVQFFISETHHCFSRGNMIVLGKYYLSDPEKFDCIVMHELSHYKNNDAIKLALGRSLCSLLFPLIIKLDLTNESPMQIIGKNIVNFILTSIVSFPYAKIREIAADDFYLKHADSKQLQHYLKSVEMMCLDEKNKWKNSPSKFQAILKALLGERKAKLFYRLFMDEHPSVGSMSKKIKLRLQEHKEAVEVIGELIQLLGSKAKFQQKARL